VSVDHSGISTNTNDLIRFFTLDPLVIARFVEDTRERYEATNAPKVIVHMSNGGARNMRMSNNGVSSAFNGYEGSR
jgi:hypothetical protein